MALVQNTCACEVSKCIGELLIDRYNNVKIGKDTEEIDKDLMILTNLYWALTLTLTASHLENIAAQYKYVCSCHGVKCNC